ncbi:MAG: DUF6686 family protein [Acidobacteriota bacterium]
MCQSTDNGISARRIFEHAGGRIIQCQHCDSIGVEFGTSYLVFTEAEFFSFLDWFTGVNWGPEHQEQGRIRIRVRSDSSLLLSLSESELRSVDRLLREGARWIAAKAPSKPASIPMATLPIGATVH